MPHHNRPPFGWGSLVVEHILHLKDEAILRHNPAICDKAKWERTIAISSL
jgi:hypothetical protein